MQKPRQLAVTCDVIFILLSTALPAVNNCKSQLGLDTNISKNCPTMFPKILKKSSKYPPEISKYLVIIVENIIVSPHKRDRCFSHCGCISVSHITTQPGAKRDCKSANLVITV